MSDRQEESKKVCVYCGSNEKLTRDHIPPKCLFNKPFPQDLITVPSCYQCNWRASSDDEYFRMMLVNRRDVGENPEALKGMEKALRSLQRKEAKGFAQSFFSGVEAHYFENEQGIIEPGAVYTADHDRLGRVASRIVRGLTWKETGVLLPGEYEVSAFVDASLPNVHEHVVGIFDEVLKEDPVCVGEAVFKYWQKSLPEDKFTRAWVLLFYESISFLCLTVKRREVS